MKARWRLWSSTEGDEETDVYYVETQSWGRGKLNTYIYRARIEVTADFDRMLGKKGFQYYVFMGKKWTELDGIGKFGLREDEYKYIDDGVY